MTGKPRPPGEPSRIVGANVRAARTGAGLTQTQLAEKLGSTQSTILNIETARIQMRVEQLLEVAVALDVAPCSLLDGAAPAPTRRRSRRRDGSSA